MSKVSSTSAFVFTDENLEQAKKILAKYPENRQESAVIPLLDLAQRQEGWVSGSIIEYIAEMLKMDLIRVHEVATFYTMFNLKPVGEYHLQICTNISCWLRGSDEIVKVCQRKLGIAVGETRSDKKFTLSEVECLGACVNAPVAWIGDDYYEDLDSGSMSKILDNLVSGKTPQAGSQIGRSGSAPEGGLTSLNSDILKPGDL